MKARPKRYNRLHLWPDARGDLWIHPPLPDSFDTLPILLTIEGQGSGRQGPPPLAPPEEPAND